MAITHDFSDIGEANFKYALFLIEKNDYLVIENCIQVQLVDDHVDIAINEMQNNDYPFRDLWINLSLGIEILAKSVLINHEIDIFSKKNGTEFSHGWNVTASSNPWLEQVFDSKNIEFVNQISTGTLWNLYTNKVKELENKGLINASEKSEIKSSLKKLANVRRNNDLHFYFKQNAFMQESDLKTVYVPLINLLLDIYHR